MIEQLVESLDACSLTDLTIRDTMTELGLTFLRDKVTLEAVVNEMTQSVKLYMAE